MEFYAESKVVILGDCKDKIAAEMKPHVMWPRPNSRPRVGWPEAAQYGKQWVSSLAAKFSLPFFEIGFVAEHAPL